MVGRTTVRGAEAVLVASDDVAGGRMAVEHLHQLGHRRIATITGLIETRPCVDRPRDDRSAIES